VSSARHDLVDLKATQGLKIWTTRTTADRTALGVPAKKSMTIALRQVLVMQIGLVSPAIVPAEMLRAGAGTPGPLPG
jgi:hypothetical protein